MYKKLIQFEWQYYRRSAIFYVILFTFLFLGFAIAAIGNFSFPGMYRNSPYMITNIIGMLSLAGIFTTSILMAQTLLREQDSRMDVLVYTTPITKWQFMGARLIGAGLLNAGLYAFAVLGMAIGHRMPWLTEMEMGPFRLQDYLWPLLVLGIPNILFCTVILAALSWIFRNKLMIYIGGLAIFIGYMIGSIMSNSPLLAGSSPASPEATSLVAKIDPFGIAAFFEQTKYWNALERNTLNIDLSGNFFINRMLLLLFSSLLISAAYWLFDFRKTKSKVIKTVEEPEVWKEIIPQSHVKQETATHKHRFATMKSYLRIDLLGIIRGIPIILILIILAVLLFVEFANAIDGGVRMPQSVATTGIIINVFSSVLPFFNILVLLFFTSEVFHRSAIVRIDMLEQATPYDKALLFFTKLMALCAIPILLISFSIVLGIIFQAVNSGVVDINLYLSMYYYIGLPMCLIAALMLGIHSIVKNRYKAIALSGIIVLLFSSGLGRSAGITHPLLRFAEVIRIPYFEMNGYGGYADSFNVRLIYNIGIAAIIAAIAIAVNSRKLNIRSVKFMLISGFVILLTAGGYIFFQTCNSNRFMFESSKLEWKVSYEKQFRQYQDMQIPTVLSVKTTIDMFPEEQRYSVKGSYKVVNLNKKPIDSILLYMDRNSNLRSMDVQRARRVGESPEYGHFWYKFDKPLMPKDTIMMNFTFDSEWLPLTDHTPFNSIIENGSFIRISNYFPRFGYQSGNETGNEKERLKRGMGSKTPIKPLDASLPEFSYDFITLDAVVSTNASQQAICTGDLVKSWKKSSRNYFHFASSGPIPFRFAVASAVSQKKAEQYKGIAIEVYYDTKHGRNVDALILSSKRTLDYCQQHFGKYPYKSVRYAEISSFAEGFAATAYPGVIYVKEDSGFAGDLTKGNKEDVINQLAGHELSHQWWATQVSPEEKEGGWLLTETLAQYTELMLYEKAHGQDRMLETVKIHLDSYLSNRAFTNELPLHKTHYDTPHLPYNKGMVVMHQLRMLMGEALVNKALRNLVVNYAYPQKPADSRDLIREFHAVSPLSFQLKINELFMKVVTYSSKIGSANVTKVQNGNYAISFHASSLKYEENGRGVRKLLPNDESIDIGILDSEGKWTIKTFKVLNNEISATMHTNAVPVKIVIDPLFKTIDTFIADNEKEL